VRSTDWTPFPGTLKSMSDLAIPVIGYKWLDVDQVGARLGVSGRTVRRLVQRRELASYRISGLIRIADADVDAYVTRSRRSAVVESG
jgi:excisionase family DNA binding protein